MTTDVFGSKSTDSTLKVAEYSKITLLSDINAASDASEGDGTRWSQVGEKILVSEDRC